MTVRINPDGSTSPVAGSMELWWRTNDGKMHDHVFSMVSMLQMQDTDRFKRNVQALRLYGSRDADSFFPQQYNNILSPAMPEARTKYNIISSTTDTVTSKIGKMKPRISYLTTGGRWDEQMRARNLTKWTDGIFYQNNIYQIHQRMFRNACIFDSGILHHYIQDGQIHTEQVIATELLVDPLDAMYGYPSHLYRIKYMRREDLIEMFPEKEQQIKISKGSYHNELRADDKLDTHVMVVEAWHLRSGPEADDGRHVICVEGSCLLDETYEKEYFPFTFFHWAPPVVGFWGQSLADRLTGNQLEINKMLRVIQKSFHLGAAFKVFLEYGSKVAREHLNNEIGSIVYYNGAKPEFYVPQTVHPEFFQFLEWLIQSSYEEAGISQLSAASRKPAELESGRALREYNLIETERFATVAQAYEKSFECTAKIYLDLAQELYENDNVDLEMTVGTRKLVESIKWSEIDVSKDDYIMKMYPTSMLPTEPAGRIATIEGWINSGLIPPDEGLRLLDFPDIEDYRSLKDSPIDLLHLVLNEMLYKGKYMAPEPFMDLSRGIGFMQDALQRAMIDEAPESRLQLIRDWIEQARVMMQSAQEAQMAAQAQIQTQSNMGMQPAEQGVAVENTPGPSIQGA